MYHQGRGVLRLKEDLCELQIFKTVAGRAALLSALRTYGIDIDSDLSGGVRQSVSAFVDICLAYPGALHRLKIQITYFEGRSRPAERAVRAIEDLLPSEWFESVSERADYVAALGRRLGPDELKRYLPAAAGHSSETPSVEAVVRTLETVRVSGHRHPLLSLSVQAGRSEGLGSPLLQWAETFALRMGVPGAVKELLEAEDRTKAVQANRSPYLTGPSAHGGTRVLAVGTEWSSSHGGLTTFNRQLCTVLAHIGADVSCIVPAPTEAERRDAADRGVALLTEPSQSPDVIIGHGWITGEDARDLAARFPTARHVHFYHMAAEENEWQKVDRLDDAGDRAAARRLLEIGLGVGADVAVAVGPRLYERFKTDLAPYPEAHLVRFDPGFDFHKPTERSVPPGAPWRILVFGRTDDVLLKGLDLAAKAVARTHRYRGERAEQIELVVRGAQAGTSQRLRDLLRAKAGIPGLKITVRPYSANVTDIAADLLEASLALLPSRTEGFGISGLEAISAGTPVLVSRESGLGMLLEEVLVAEQAQRSVVPVSYDDETDTDVWDRAVWAMLRDREASFTRAAELHRTMAAKRTWRDAVTSLIERVEQVERRD